MKKVHRAKALVIAGLLAGIMLSACNGGRDGAIGGVDVRDQELLPIVDKGGIQGRVNGALYAFDGDMRLTVATADTRNLQALNRGNDAEHWAINQLPLRTGEYPCGSNDLQLSLQRVGQDHLSTAGPAGQCQVVVTRANSRFLEGYFAAEFAANNGARTRVEEGRFRFELAHVIPDSDADGLSDADDNCPFDVNPAEEDGNNNGAGTACDASEQG
nr:hypothetical protein [Oceanococcus sp. HetDA_MAG_MS8]